LLYLVDYVFGTSDLLIGIGALMAHRFTFHLADVPALGQSLTVALPP
jgi:hypothetical protein